jgi:assimilatory nitrate reductase catalytic subunit
VQPGRLARVLRRTDGPLAAELARVPGDFGLGQVPARLAPEATVRSICGFCSVGCSLEVHVRAGRAVNLTPTRGHPVNRGAACPKGWEALAPLAAADRATTPLVRDRRGRLVPVTWNTAVTAFVERVRAVQARYGPDSVAFLSTGQITTEEMAFLGALAKFGMGIRHGDGNTRQCMATAVVAYKESFGFDAPPYTYADLEHSDVIVFIGSNPCITHPVLWERVRANPHRPEVIVVDPRITETAVAATRHVRPRPKSDLHLLYGVAHVLCERDLIDRDFIDAHTVGFDAFARHVRAFPPERVAHRTGLTVREIEDLAETVGRGERVSFWWTMGVNQSHQGVRTAQAVINLALMTGNIGRPGTGANSITGQCNAMGSRLFANTTNLLGGHDFADAAHRAKVAEILGIDPGRIPDRAGLAYDQILDAVLDGTIRALWVIATNPVHSWIENRRLAEALDRLELLVVQDMYTTTETARRADILFPAAGWGEKEGTFVNSERRIGVVRRVADPPGTALADFAIFRRIAEAWGCADMFRAWSSPEATFRLLARLTAGQPCDFSGVESYAQIEAAGGIQWPFPAGSTEAGAERRLFGDGRFFHPDGRARFVFGDPRPPREATSPRYPLVLLTGRGTSAEWHTGTRTAKSPLLRSLAPAELQVDIAPADAEARGIRTGDRVVVASARGSLVARARVSATVAPGQVFLPMHDPRTNVLTLTAVDPHSRLPAYKWAAVDVRPCRPRRPGRPTSEAEETPTGP